MKKILATLLVGVALLANLGMAFLAQDQAMVAAMLGFFSRR